jgi:hypothetical protein
MAGIPALVSGIVNTAEQVAAPAAATATATTFLQGVAQRAQQRVDAKLQELMPRVQSGQLSPGDALLNVQRAAEQVVTRTQFADGPGMQGATVRQAQQAVRQATRRAVEAAGRQLQQARGQQRAAGTSPVDAIRAMIDPVGAALDRPVPRLPPASPQPSAVLPTLLGAGLGVTAAKMSGQSLLVGLIGGGLIGLGYSLFVRPQQQAAQAVQTAAQTMTQAATQVAQTAAQAVRPMTTVQPAQR